MKTDANSQYRHGFRDAFDGRQKRQDYLNLEAGIAWYIIGYEHGEKALAHPPGITLVSDNPCPGGIERIYITNFIRVTCRFSNATLNWQASIPGYHGADDMTVARAILNLPPRFISGIAA